MTQSRTIIGRERAVGPITPTSHAPLPREELRDLAPVDRVLTQLDALGLQHQRTSYGHAAQCPFHESGLGRLNFDISVADQPRRTRGGAVHPAGTVYVRCQAY